MIKKLKEPIDDGAPYDLKNRNLEIGNSVEYSSCTENSTGT